MKWFVSYRFTGEDPGELKEIMENICSTLESKGHENYCSFFDNGLVDKGKKEIFSKALNEIDNSEGVLIFMKSEDKSEGMLMEVGYSLAKKKKLILVIKKDVQNTHLRELIGEVIEFEDIGELNDKLKELK